MNIKSISELKSKDINISQLSSDISYLELDIKNKELADFIYINDANDLQEKLQKIKSDKNLYNRIVELERSEIQNQFGHFKKS